MVNPRKTIIRQGHVKNHKGVRQQVDIAGGEEEERDYRLAIGCGKSQRS